MLARENPLADDGSSNPTMLPALSGGSAAGGAAAGAGGVVISRRRSSTGDSDFDCSDDDDGIARLKDDLRTTTERFFERLPRQQEGEGRQPHRRASGFVSAGTSGGASGSGIGVQSRSAGGSLQPSWNALEQLEKGVGGMMRRHTGTASTGLRPLDDSSSWSSDALVVDGFGSQRGDGGSSSPAPRPSPAGGGGGVPRRRPHRDSSRASVSELKARSEEAARTLNALKALLAEDDLDGGDDGHQGQQRRGGNKPWPAVGERGAAEAEAEVEAEAPPPRPTGATDGASRVDASKRMELIMQAMDTLQQINVELNSRLQETRRRGASGRESDRDRDHRRHHRRVSSASSASSRLALDRQQQLSKRLLGGTSAPGSGGLLSRHPRSSSDLLSHRRSEKGQAEPMSCGVPRHRVQVSEGGENDVVYFELCVWQARSTWTLERRMDEFVELRRSLVATATDLAAATAAEERRRQAARAKQASAGGGGGLGGFDSREVGVPRDLAEARREHRREAEARVPELPPERKSWFDSSSIWSVMYARKREEKLTERQVHLASWLAHVLADRELVSPDLVRFLGGDSGGVRARPVLEDDIGTGLGGSARSSISWSSSGDDDEELDFRSEDDDDGEDGGGDDNDLGTDELDSLRGSLSAPDELDLAKSGSGSGSRSGSGAEVSRRSGRGGSGGGGSSGGSSKAFSPRFRLEKVMGKRISVEARNGGGGAGETGVASFSGISAGLTAERGTAATDDEEEEEEDEEEEEVGEDEEEVHSPELKHAFLASMDASRQPRAPSPSSPTRGVTLDAFFQAPS